MIDDDPVVLLDGRAALVATPPSAGAGYTVDDLLPEVLDSVLALVQADTAAVLLLDPSGRFLVATAARGLEAEVRHLRPAGLGDFDCAHFGHSCLPFNRSRG